MMVEREECVVGLSGFASAAAASHGRGGGAVPSAHHGPRRVSFPSRRAATRPDVTRGDTHDMFVCLDVGRNGGELVEVEIGAVRTEHGL